MENIEEQATVPKWVQINQPEIPPKPPNLSTLFVCPSPKIWNFDKKAALVIRSPWINPSGSRHVLTPFKIILTFVKGVILQHISVNLQACFHPYFEHFPFPKFDCKHSIN